VAAGVAGFEFKALIDLFARLDGVEDILALLYLTFAAFIQSVFRVDQFTVIR